MSISGDAHGKEGKRCSAEGRERVKKKNQEILCMSTNSMMDINIMYIKNVSKLILKRKKYSMSYTIWPT